MVNFPLIGRESLKDALMRAPKPVGVFAANDYMAEQTIAMAQTARIPAVMRRISEIRSFFSRKVSLAFSPIFLTMISMVASSLQNL